MNFHDLRRFMFLIAAAALLLVTVLPNNMVSSGMADEHPAVSATMSCSDCSSNMMNGGTTSCAQITCVGFAIIAESVFDLARPRGTFFQTAGLQPEEISLAPATPPI